MKLIDNIQFIDLGIFIKGHLILSDFHIGYEEALNKQGYLIPRFQFSEIILRLKKIFMALRNRQIVKIIINGDLKHEFGKISEQEWRLTLKLLDFLAEKCEEIILIKGNHDAILGKIAEKRNLRFLDYYIIDNLKNKYNFLIIHGDRIPSDNIIKKSNCIIIGHEHPAVSINSGPRTEIYKCYLTGEWNKKFIIVQPSFNLVVEGTDVLKEKLLSPFLQGTLDNFDVYVAEDKVYYFGKLRNVKKRLQHENRRHYIIGC